MLVHSNIGQAHVIFIFLMIKTFLFFNQEKKLLKLHESLSPYFLGVFITLSLLPFFIIDIHAILKQVNQFAFWSLFLLMILLFAISLRKIIKHELLLEINHSGIWSPKTGMLAWNSLEYYYLTIEFSNRGKTRRCILFLKKFYMTEEIQIYISKNTWIEKDKMKKYVNLFKGSYNVSYFTKQ